MMLPVCFLIKSKRPRELDEELEQFFVDAATAFNDASIYNVAVNAASALDDAFIAIQVIQDSDAYKNATGVMSDATDEAAILVKDVQAIIELDLDNIFDVII